MRTAVAVRRFVVEVRPLVAAGYRTLSRYSVPSYA
jgi:hypothetical protein